MKRNVEDMDNLLLYMEKSPAAWIMFESVDQKPETVVALYLLADRGHVALKETTGSAIARITWDGYKHLEAIHINRRQRELEE